jgi:periplasmic divalent cation tolerance protein
MSEREIIWVVVNTNSTKEADKIGRACLKARVCACYALTPRLKSVYFWPPKSNKLETSKGPLLTLETLPKHYSKIVKLVKQLHSDQVPLIGQWEIENVTPDFYKWMKGEVD